MERLTKRIDGYAYGKSGIKRLSKDYHRGSFECTALIERLAEYEEAEEKGLLLQLPCKVGDVIYKIPSQTNYKLNMLNGCSENNRVYAQEVNKIELFGNGSYVLVTCDGMDSVLSDYFNETWFLTREKAEEKLIERLCGNLVSAREDAEKN